MMRILFVSLHYAPEPTGNAPYVASLAEELAARGHEVEVITTHPHYPQWRIADGYGQWVRRERPAPGLTITRLRHLVPRHPGTLNRALGEASFGVRALFARWPGADAVVLVSPGLITSAIVRPRARRAPKSFVWVQDIYSLGLSETGQGGGAAAAAMAAIERGTLRAPMEVIAIHDRFKAHLSRSLGLAPDDVHVVRNWTHLDTAPLPDERAQTRAAFGWRDDETIVLHAGNQGVKQGLENVVDAARVADARQSAVRFVLLGHGNQHDMLRQRASGIRRLDFVEPLPDDEYRRVMAAADVLLVNERAGVTEMSVPSKLTSYFAAGVPVLAATDRGSVTAEEVRAAGAGLRVDAGDPDALVAGVEGIMLSPARRAEFAAAGRAYMASRLSKAAAVDAVEAILSTSPAVEPAAVPTR